MSVGKLGANQIVDSIYRENALYETGLQSKGVATKEIGKLIGSLIASEDVTVEHARQASQVLDAITKEEAPTTGGIFDKLKQIVSDLRGKSATFEKTQAPQTREGLEKLKKDALLATLPYTASTGKPIGADFDGPASTRIALSLEQKLQGDFQNPQTKRLGLARNEGLPSAWGNIVDKKSGLTANIVVDRASKEVKIIFGGTTSGTYRNDDVNNYSFLKRSRNNAVSTLSQWVSNIKAGLGIKPHSLEQAAHLTTKVLELVKEDPNFSDLRGFSVSTIGHSKGASEAVYAALAQKEPLKAVGFSSADLGGALVRGLPPENVAKAKELVSHFHVKADLVPNLRFITPSLRPLGREAVIPASSSLTTPLSRHDAFANHITHWADEQLSQLTSSGQAARPGEAEIIEDDPGNGYSFVGVNAQGRVAASPNPQVNEDAQFPKEAGQFPEHIYATVDRSRVRDIAPEVDDVPPPLPPRSDEANGV